MPNFYNDNVNPNDNFFGALGVACGEKSYKYKQNYFG